MPPIWKKRKCVFLTLLFIPCILPQSKTHTHTSVCLHLPKNYFAHLIPTGLLKPAAPPGPGQGREPGETGHGAGNWDWEDQPDGGPRAAGTEGATTLAKSQNFIDPASIPHVCAIFSS